MSFSRTLRPIAVVAGVSAGLLACSGSATSTGGGSTADAQAFIAQFCEIVAPCCSRVQKPTDGASCRATYGTTVDSALYDATSGGACLSELRAQQSRSDFCEAPATGTSSCKAVFKQTSGTAKPGENCEQSDDCASSLEGSVSCAAAYGGHDAVIKSCQIQVDGKAAGDTPCVATRDGNVTYGLSSFTDKDTPPVRPPLKGYVCDLAANLYCNSTTNACTRVGGVGETCDPLASESCEKSAACDFTSKKCVTRLARGADCSRNPGGCGDGDVCDTATFKCIAGLPEGTPCVDGRKCASSSCVNGKCGGSGPGGSVLDYVCGR